MDNISSSTLLEAPVSRRNVLFGIVAAGFTVGGLSACSSGEVSDSESSGGKTRITYLTRSGSNEDFITELYGPQFQQETGTEVAVQQMPADDLFVKVLVLAASGELPDLVFGYDNPWLQLWGASEVMLPLNDLMQADNYDAREQFYAAAVDAVSIGDEIMGLPTTGHAGAVQFYFNRTMLDEAGIAPPDANGATPTWDWDDLLTAAKALTKRSGSAVDTWGYRPLLNNGSYHVMTLRQFGSDSLSDDGTSTPLDNAQGKAAYQYLWSLMFEHGVTPTGTEVPVETDPNQLQGQYFATGKVAMYTAAIAAITNMDEFVNDSFEWGAYPLPEGPAGTRGGTMFLSTTSINRQTEAAGPAWDFLKLITGHEAGVEKALMGSGTPGARPDVFTDPRLSEKWPFFNSASEVLEEARPFNVPANYRSNEVTDAMYQESGAIFLNEVNGNEGASRIAARIRTVLDKPSI